MGQTKTIQGSQVTGPLRPDVNCSPLKRACRALFFCLPLSCRHGVNLAMEWPLRLTANRLAPQVVETTHNKC
jgi:hypothetical protein